MNYTVIFYASIMVMLLPLGRCCGMNPDPVFSVHKSLQGLSIADACSSLYSVACSLVVGNPVIKPWADNQADQLLKKQDYTELVPWLRDLLERDVLNKSEVFEWIANKALTGDVPMMYLYLRNVYKVLSGGAALERVQLKAVTTMLLCSLIRLAQDNTCCEHFAHERVLQQSSDLCAYASTWYSGDIVTTFKRKYYSWFSALISEEKCPFAAACDEVAQWFARETNSASMVTITPIWVKYCYQKMASTTGQIIFETPDEHQRKTYLNSDFTSVIDKYRGACLTAMLEKFRGYGSWKAFFADVVYEKKNSK